MQTAQDLLFEEETRSKLLGSLIYFTQVFYKLRTGRDFEISQPIARESHHITICRAFTSVFKGDITRLLVNIAPGSGKSELLKHFIAWAMAWYPDSKFLYISYSHDLAAYHTHTIKQIMQLPLYRRLFGIELRADSTAKNHFQNLNGGTVYAAGSGGTITGFDAGLPLMKRFTGAIIMDDMHKPSDVHSDVEREKVKDNFHNTIIHRKRSPTVPIIFVGQRLHESDLPASLLAKEDGYDWDKIILKSIDEVGNVLYPKIHPKEHLLTLQESSPYSFSSQYQQDPQPAGGGIFPTNRFLELEKEPEILATFITADTAETDKDYNDATVFSFWGVHKIIQNNIETELYGLVWLDCVELRIEPKDLESEFLAFYAQCMQHNVKPKLAAIEKKSTGVTLLSVLKNMQGLEMLDISRTRASGNKTSRFLEIQPYIYTQRVSFLPHAKHKKMCIEHCGKITANNTHRFDDIADTLYDAVKLALIDQIIINRYINKTNDSTNKVVKEMAQEFAELQRLRGLRK